VRRSNSRERSLREELQGRRTEDYYPYYNNNNMSASAAVVMNASRSARSRYTKLDRYAPSRYAGSYADRSSSDERSFIVPALVCLAGVCLIAVGAWSLASAETAGEARSERLQPYVDAVSRWEATARADFAKASFAVASSPWGDTTQLAPSKARQSLSKTESKHDDIPEYEGLTYSHTFQAKLDGNEGGPDMQVEVSVAGSDGGADGAQAQIKLPPAPLRTHRITHENAKMCRIHGGVMLRTRGGGCGHTLILSELCVVVARDPATGSWMRAPGNKASCWPSRMHTQYFRGEGTALYRQVNTAAVMMANRVAAELRNGTKAPEASSSSSSPTGASLEKSSSGLPAIGIGAAESSLPAVMITVRHIADPEFIALNVTSGAGYFGATAKETSVDGWVMICVGLVLMLPVGCLVCLEYAVPALGKMRVPRVSLASQDRLSTIGRGGGGSGGCMVEMLRRSSGVGDSSSGTRPTI